MTAGGPVVLVVLDGWGLAPPGPGNAVELASTPVFDALRGRYPGTRLDASGRAVGLPEGQQGNSEVGHLNLGAGRVVRQELVRIDDEVESGRLAENPALIEVCRIGRERSLHLMGLVSEGGVHSHVRHLRALLRLAGEREVERVHVHAFTDGRDTSPTSGADVVGSLPAIRTVVGRYYAMDRDGRWDRTKRAYDALVHGEGDRAGDAAEALRERYAAGVTDEFVEPIVVGDPAQGRIADGDAVVFFNFRPDRARQLSRSLAQADFDAFDRGADPPRPHLVTMTRYEDDLDVPVAYPPERPREVLADVLAAAGVRQLHMAETEKYAHVTYFFDGGDERRRDGEDWVLIPSPRHVATYDEAPEMSAPEVARRFAEAFADGTYGFSVVNFANPDMVGHTGVISAAVAAVETVDACLGTVVETVERLGGVCLVTADHGNAEQMLTKDGSPHTAHTTNPVPLVVTREGLRTRDGGRLADIAPTVLALLRIEQPAAMDGEPLLRG